MAAPGEWLEGLVKQVKVIRESASQYVYVILLTQACAHFVALGGTESGDKGEDNAKYLGGLFGDNAEVVGNDDDRAAAGLQEQRRDERIGIKPTMQDEVDAYMKIVPINEHHKAPLDRLSIASVLDFWRINGHGLFRLSFLSSQTVIIKLSSADTERVFSTSGDITRGKRGGTSSKRIEELVLINKNSGLLLKDTKANTEQFWRENLTCVKNAKHSASVRSKNYVQPQQQATGLWTKKLKKD
jgi:hypothetical protein